MSPAESLVEPNDEFNRQLVANVHPTEWTNPTPAGRYNLVVIGAGTAGLVTAAIAAGLGARASNYERPSTIMAQWWHGDGTAVAR